LIYYLVSPRWEEHAKSVQTLPEFLSPDVLALLQEKFNFKPIGTAATDLRAMVFPVILFVLAVEVFGHSEEEN